VPTTELCAELTGMGFKQWRSSPAASTRGSSGREALERAARRMEGGPERPGRAARGPHGGREKLSPPLPGLRRHEQGQPRVPLRPRGRGPAQEGAHEGPSRLHFAGFFSRDEIGRYYASADIYIHASLTETFGNVLTEAMASGLAVAGFDYAAARIFVKDGESGLTAPCDDPEGAGRGRASGLRPIPALRTRLGRGREAVEAQSWETVIARFEANLEEAAGVAHTQQPRPGPRLRWQTASSSSRPPTARATTPPRTRSRPPSTRKPRERQGGRRLRPLEPEAQLRRAEGLPDGDQRTPRLWKLIYA
jgi:hypothetical protein